MRAAETEVSYSRWAWALVWAGFPVVGAGLFWLVKSMAGWVAGLAWVPFQGLFKLVASIDEPQATIGALAVGAAAGFVVSFLAAQDALKVTVSDSVVDLRRGSEPERVVARGAVTGVFVDAKQLVLLGSRTAELVREKSDLDEAALRHAFESHGWPWLPGDPYAELFRRFVEDDPGLPPAANAILKARAKALSKNDSEDLAEFRAELAKLGVVVRDEKKRQSWRLIKE